MLEIPDSVRVRLLTRHRINETEIVEAFANREHGLYEDTNNKTVPPVQWFVAETNAGRMLKVMFILNGRRVILRDASPASAGDHITAQDSKVDQAQEELLNVALGLKSLVCRFEQDTLHDLKSIAALYGVGYQTLVKQILVRFIEGEQKMLANELIRDTLRQRQEQYRSGGNEFSGSEVTESKEKVG